jgi:hypothetical protein
MFQKPDLNFDVETAIKVCRQAGYHEIALELARSHRAHHWYVRILLEDLKRDEQALRYIELLSFDEVWIFFVDSLFCAVIFSF